MKLRVKALFVAMVGASIFFLLRRCDRPIGSPTAPGTLAPGEKERVEVRGKTVTVIRADRTVRTYAPGGAKVHVGDDGRVSVEIKTWGFSHEPGLGVAWDGDRLKLALDMKLVYYRRLGLHLGSAYDPTRAHISGIVRPVAFASYTVPFDGFANTSLWFGTELFPRQMAGGIRLAF
jgi:hypothetical protein